MDLSAAIYQRRSTRHFKTVPVPEDLINQLLDSAVQAPSATNAQPWAFAVIQQPGILTKWSEDAKALLLKSMEQFPLLKKYEQALQNPHYNIFYNAPALILVLAKPSDTVASEDCCLAAQNLMLAAHGLGLGACWIGFARPYLNQPEVKPQIGIPDDYEVIAPLVLGYPHHALPYMEKKPPEIVFWLK